MGIGVSVFLIALGAILTFALEVELAGLDLDVVGWILMLVGVIGLLVTLTIWGPRRRASVTTTSTATPPVTEYREDRVYRDEPATYRRVERRTDDVVERRTDDVL